MANENEIQRLRDDFDILIERFEDRIRERSKQDSEITAAIARTGELARSTEVRVGTAERELSKLADQARQPTDWTKILTVVFASAALVSGLTNYAIGNIERFSASEIEDIERRLDADERVISRWAEKVEVLEEKMASGYNEINWHKEWIASLQEGLQRLETTITESRIKEEARN